MEAHRRTWFDARGLIVGDRALPFYAGAMHYWRVAPKRWAGCLRAMHGLGLTIVETYVPWRIHEPDRGAYDWTGANDLAAFIDAARTAGLAVVLRPGPHVNAELTSAGMPDHVIDDAGCQARTSGDTPAWLPSLPRAWPIPSYASTAFHERVRAWYAEVAQVIAPHLAPASAVVALGVDNETQMFYRMGAYDLDYHPDALAWWTEATGYEAPPRAWSEADAARCVAWVRFKDHYLSRALRGFAASLDAVGLAGVARFHNLPRGHHGLVDPRGVQAAIGGPAGLTASTSRPEFRELRRRANALVAAATPVPLAFEVGVGSLPWFPPLDDGDDKDRERDQVLALLAAGVRGFNLFMTVERDRHHGAAITQDGRVEPHATWIKPLLAALAEVEWPSLRARVSIALVGTKADARFGLATCVSSPMTPVVSELLELGPGGAAELGTDEGAITARRWQTAIAGALELAQVPYAIVDEDATEDELARYRAVIVPTDDRVDGGLWRRLHALAEHKRTILVLGPATPTRDELGRPLTDPPPRRAGRIRTGSLDDLPGLAGDLAALAGELPEAWQIERPDDVRAIAHATPAGVVKVVFVVSDANKLTSAVLVVGEATSLRDPFSHERIRIVEGRATLSLPPRGVRMLLVS